MRGYSGNHSFPTSFYRTPKITKASTSAKSSNHTHHPKPKRPKAKMSRRGYPLYAYRPSKAGAIIFCLLFITATAFHLWRMIRCRSWFMTAFVIGGMRTSSPLSLSLLPSHPPCPLSKSHLPPPPPLFSCPANMLITQSSSSATPAAPPRPRSPSTTTPSTPSRSKTRTSCSRPPSSPPAST